MKDKAYIDLVIPMVFPDDAKWLKVYSRYHKGDARGHVRFRSWGTEELLVKCCMKYLPWLRCIHLLLAGESQVQGWMEEMGARPWSEDDERRQPAWREWLDGARQWVARVFGGEAEDEPHVPFVRVAFHRDFIPEDRLPCFSSPCIEMFLHRIPGLSEHFIYANDDMFPLSPLEEGDFFRKTDSGIIPCQKLAEIPYPTRPNIFHRACMGGLNMVAAPFGRQFKRTYLKNGHSFAPYLKSSCEEVWRRHGEQILEKLSPLSRTADSYNQYLYAYYQHLAGLEIPHAPREQYVGRHTLTDDLAGIIRDPEAGIVCLNDNENIANWRQRAEIVRREMREKLEN